MTDRSFTAIVGTSDSAGQLVVPFDPKAAFGKVRAPVVVTVNGYSYRSSICVMGGPPFVPLRLSHREAAGIAPGDEVEVTLALDTAPRIVEPPEDLVAALRETGAWPRWEALSYTAQREHADAVEQAKKPETRANRIEKIAARLGG